jgi:26S proteasome regulatory subunit N12
MAVSLEQATETLGRLSAKVQQGDVEGGNDVLAEMKILMLDFPSTDNEYNTIAAEALEMGVLLSVADEDLDSFARNVSQLKSYYSITTSKTTDQKCQIIGLNLMYLLVENNLSEFHSELEFISHDKIQSSSPYITFPINIERQLMVGSYDQVLLAFQSSNIPHTSYQFFIDNLLQTVRDSIADCVEVSYRTLAIGDAVNIMKFTSEEELMEYVRECRDDWIVNDSVGEGKKELCFQLPDGGSKASDIPSKKLIAQTLSYATELERIV